MNFPQPKQEWKEVEKNEIIETVNRDPLTISEKKKIVQCAEEMLVYLNPNDKILSNRWNVDVSHLLETLTSELTQLSNFDFHQNMCTIFRSVHDHHASYDCGTECCAIAELGFSIVQIYDRRNDSKYIVSEIDLDHGFLEIIGFSRGVEVISVDGKPILNCAIELAELSTYTNDCNRLFEGLKMISFRDINRCPMPENDYVNIEYLLPDGACRTHQFKWKYSILTWKQLKQNSSNEDNGLPYYGRLQSHCEMGNKKMEKTSMDLKDSKIAVKIFDEYKMELGVIGAALKCQSNSIAYLKIFDFNQEWGSGPDMKNKMLSMFQKMRDSLDNTVSGVVIDLRGNHGGWVSSVAQFLKWVSSREEFSLINQIRISSRLTDLHKRPRHHLMGLINEAEVNEAIDLGLSYSPPYVVTESNSDSQEWTERLTVITDAESTSAAEVFSSWVVDYHLGTVVGIHPTTAGCAASVINSKNSADLKGIKYQIKDQDLCWYLPRDIIMQAPFEKSYRSSALQERHNFPDLQATSYCQRLSHHMEFSGVKPHHRYYLTKDDIMHGDRDLFKYIALNCM